MINLIAAASIAKELPKVALEKLSEVANTISPTQFMLKAIIELPLESLKTLNECLEGLVHPITNVPFVRKIVEFQGRIIEGVFPKFDSMFDAKLDEGFFSDTDANQFDEANRQLLEEIKKNEELRDQFTQEQLEQIENGDTPDRYTWHHKEDPGVMQLVQTEVHQKTAHTGGRSIWGGGSLNR